VQIGAESAHLLCEAPCLLKPMGGSGYCCWTSRLKSPSGACIHRSERSLRRSGVAQARRGSAADRAAVHTWKATRTSQRAVSGRDVSKDLRHDIGHGGPSPISSMPSAAPQATPLPRPASQHSACMITEAQLALSPAGVWPRECIAGQPAPLDAARVPAWCRSRWHQERRSAAR
jgi:hypothetical protein